MGLIRRMAAKALGFPIALFSGNSTVAFDWDYWFPTPSDEDFANALLQADRSSLVMGCVQFLVSNGTQTPWCMYDAEGEMVEKHPILDLLRQPSPTEDATALLSGVYTSLSLNGNAYAIIVPNMGGRVGELQYVPHTLITPKQGEDGRISHYLYTVNNVPRRYEVDEVLHIRRYVNWRYPCIGQAPIHYLGPEIWLDMEATRFQAAMLKNRGTPGGIMTPDTTKQDAYESIMSAADVRTTRDYMRSEYTGDKRGNWLVMNRPMKVTPFTFDPRTFDMSNIRDYCEERMGTAFGFPPAVIGFAKGIEQTTENATLIQYEKQAWMSGIIPLQDLIASQIGRQLDLEEGFRLGFDRSQVSALQEDENSRATRWKDLVSTGGVSLDEFRTAFSFEVRPTDRVYLRPISITEVPVGMAQADVDAAAAERNLDMESQAAAADEEEDDDDDEDTEA